MITEIKTEIKQLRLDALKELYPGKTIKSWSVGPWEEMCPVRFPSLKPASVDGTMMKDEYLELSAGISNLSNEKQIVRIAVNPKKSGIPAKALELRISYWVKAVLLKEDQKADREKFHWVDDVLPLLNKGKYTSLNPGENRRIWLTVDSSAVKPGTYNFAVEVRSVKGNVYEIPVKLTVLPLKLQRDPNLAVYTYAYLNRGSTNRFRKFVVGDLLKHYQNTFVLNLLPKYDAAKGTADFSTIVNYLKYIPKDAKRIMFSGIAKAEKFRFVLPKTGEAPHGRRRLKKLFCSGMLNWKKQALALNKL